MVELSMTLITRPVSLVYAKVRARVHGPWPFPCSARYALLAQQFQHLTLWHKLMRREIKWVCSCGGWHDTIIKKTYLEQRFAGLFGLMLLLLRSTLRVFSVDRTVANMFVFDRFNPARRYESGAIKNRSPLSSHHKEEKHPSHARSQVQTIHDQHVLLLLRNHLATLGNLRSGRSSYLMLLL